MARTAHLKTIGLSHDEKAELLIELLESDEVSWFNAISDALAEHRVVNSHSVMERLADALIAVGMGEGFPFPIYSRMVFAAMQKSLDYHYGRESER